MRQRLWFSAGLIVLAASCATSDRGVVTVPVASVSTAATTPTTAVTATGYEAAPEATPPRTAPEASTRPAPTEHRLDGDAERRNRVKRKQWLESMHKTAPGTDWREIERTNRRLDQQRRNELGRTAGFTGGAPGWSEVGSRNQAGRVHATALSPDGTKLYVGSSNGGVWRGNLDGTGWEPLGDNLWGGAHELLVLPGESAGEPDVIFAATDGGLFHVSRDQGLTWDEPPGIGDLSSVRGIGALQDAARTIFVYGRGPSTGGQSTVFMSTDYGRTFATVWTGSTGWDGWLWIPRSGPQSLRWVYIIDQGRLWYAKQGNGDFSQGALIDTGATRGVLTGSEAGSPTLYAALQVAGQWKLFRSDNAGGSWTFVQFLDDFWQTLGASSIDPNTMFYGGVEAFRSVNGGVLFNRINFWYEYYEDPANKLHADVPGIHSWPDPANPGQELWYISTDGGLYGSSDGGFNFTNLTLEGLGVSQYYSTLSSSADWDRVAAGAQDQGYQLGSVQRTPTAGPTSDFDQVISGDYGHLTSRDGTHGLVYSTYPGFMLVQDGPYSPPVYQVNFPAGVNSNWLPCVVADPDVDGRVYFCGDKIYRGNRTGSTSQWIWTTYTPFQFGGAAVPGNFLTAMTFAPTDSDRVYAANDAGRLFYSTDRGIQWTESPGTAPSQQYFYGHALTVHPDNAFEAAVGGSGYSNPGVMRTVDGGLSWSPEANGLPATLVYALAYAEDGSGDLYAGTETGAYRWDRITGLWESITGNEAPTTVYWSVEPVNDGGTMRFGTYGRGIWDYAIDADDRDGDGVDDLVDICPNYDDPAQTDSDLDSAGDACDNCPGLANLGQLDADADTLGDACDNCPTAFNHDQTDGDLDSAGDVCDCAPANGGVFAFPTEVAGLSFDNPGSLSWGSIAGQAGTATTYLVARGDLSGLPLKVDTPCTRTPIAGTAIATPEIPPPNTAYWYLTWATNTCGEGTPGRDRPTPTCN